MKKNGNIIVILVSAVIIVLFGTSYFSSLSTENEIIYYYYGNDEEIDIDDVSQKTSKSSSKKTTTTSKKTATSTTKKSTTSVKTPKPTASSSLSSSDNSVTSEELFPDFDSSDTRNSEENSEELNSEEIDFSNSNEAESEEENSSDVSEEEYELLQERVFHLETTFGVSILVNVTNDIVDEEYSFYENIDEVHQTLDALEETLVSADGDLHEAFAQYGYMLEFVLVYDIPNENYSESYLTDTSAQIYLPYTPNRVSYLYYYEIQHIVDAILDEHELLASAYDLFQYCNPEDFFYGTYREEYFLLPIDKRYFLTAQAMLDIAEDRAGIYAAIKSEEIHLERLVDSSPMIRKMTALEQTIQDYFLVLLQ